MDSLLKPPPGAELTETRGSIYWIDEEGILYSVSKKVPPMSLDEITEAMNEFKRITNGRKFCMLGDVSNRVSNTKEAREFAAREFPKVITALAMVSSSAVGRMVANMFLAIKPTPYPAKMFGTEKDAKDWLRQYL